MKQLTFILIRQLFNLIDFYFWIGMMKNSYFYDKIFDLYEKIQI
jgi:hypothetical protein